MNAPAITTKKPRTPKPKVGERSRQREKRVVTRDGVVYTLAIRTETGPGPCPGEAHENLHIDNCMVCLNNGDLGYGRIMTYAPLTLDDVKPGVAVPVSATSQLRRPGQSDKDTDYNRAVWESAERDGLVRMVSVEEKIERKSSASYMAYVKV